MSNKVLIVEDNKIKSKALRECLLDALPDVEIVQTDTIAIAGQLIESESWKGILLDLAFHKTQQNVDLVDRTYLAGIGLLQQMNEMRKKCPVIVATQHDSFVNTKYGTFKDVDEINSKMRLAFPENYKGLVKVELGSTVWREELRKLIGEHFL